MGRFATHEDEVDDFFRLGVFVDLYRVVRQGLRAGVESYSIKRLEKLIGFERNIDLEDATENLIAFESALDEGEAAEDLETRKVVAGYNEDDCRATLALRDWLEARRVELAAKVGEPLPRPLAQEEDDAHADPRPGPPQSFATGWHTRRPGGANRGGEGEELAGRSARVAPP